MVEILDKNILIIDVSYSHLIKVLLLIILHLAVIKADRLKNSAKKRPYWPF